ncbi:MAG: DUF2442 domain-containing protein [Oscillospiraceae bacterium]
MTDTSVISVQALSDYRLKLFFVNGSEAIVNLGKRVQAIRFHKLSNPKLFATAQINGDSVVWSLDGDSVRATVNELLDSMLV